MRVFLGPDAIAHVAQIDAWWREHRPISPDLFRQEFGAVLQALVAMPHMGGSYRGPDVEGVRRTTLRATRYHVYYRATSESIEVLAVWSAIRGAGPDFAHFQ